MPASRQCVVTPLTLPSLRDGGPPPNSLVERRGAVLSPSYPPIASVDTREIVLGGLDCVSCTVEGARGILFHIHGGGFRFGGPGRLQPFAAMLAARVHCTVVVPAYKLAPEQPFPAALHGLMAAYQQLYADELVVIGGDSAGANLAAGLCLLGARADAVFLLSPWLDLRVISDAYDRAAATDKIFSRASAEEARDAYLQGWPADDPLVSPLLADLTGFPPTFLLAGGAEVLLDDSLNFAAALAIAGTEVDLRVVPGMQHVAPTFNGEWLGAAAAVDASVHFLRSHLG